MAETKLLANEMAQALRTLVKACPSHLPCGAFHHDKADWHAFAAPCPVLARYEAAQDAAMAAVKAWEVAE